MNKYEDMLARIKLYRKNHNLFQNQMGEKIGLSQERYSYLETGETKLSYESMMLLDQLGLNVNYLIAGDERSEQTNEFVDMLNQTKDLEKKDFVLRLSAEVILHFLKTETYAKEVHQERTLLKDTLKYWDKFSMIRIVREELGYSQESMADLLSVGVKMYRKFEREVRFPDAEIIMQLHDLTKYEPLLFVDSPNRKQKIVKNAWQLLNEKDREKVIAFMNHLESTLM